MPARALVALVGGADEHGGGRGPAVGLLAAERFLGRRAEGDLRGLGPLALLEPLRGGERRLAALRQLGRGLLQTGEDRAVVGGVVDVGAGQVGEERGEEGGEQHASMQTCPPPADEQIAAPRTYQTARYSAGALTSGRGRGRPTSRRAGSGGTCFSPEGIVGPGSEKGVKRGLRARLGRPRGWLGLSKVCQKQVIVT